MARWRGGAGKTPPNTPEIRIESKTEIDRSAPFSSLVGEAKPRGDSTETDQLRERAKSLGVHPEELARAAVVDLLSSPDEEFRTAAEEMLHENHELYKRLMSRTRMCSNGCAL